MANDSSKRRRSKDLSGLWTGFYAYDLTEDAVMFTAWLKEESGEVTGSILEENLNDDDDPEAEYEARITGFRQGLDVQFSKIALDEENGEPVVLRYTGDVDPDCCMISGVWFFDDPSDWTGTFMMTRISGELKARTAVSTARAPKTDEE